ncbi:hypothetical protein [Thermosulfurimonas dismutans]|uniref:Uncharacterized protein n=1 Tax=Thermosulfurimonas dismutans TaxID=999894 RepID=A0A179D2Q0_9BACT|nr:hypothetical protein [Thermosulfurimonas dismutans]OAQ20337.1 hypothetical protein TDIS_1532 [Thermosulfurimonas dismutans]
MKAISREELNQVMAYYFKASFTTRSEEADKEEWSRILQEVEATEEELSTPEWQEALKYLAEH